MILRTIFTTLALAGSLSAASRVFQSFEGDGFDDWQVEGTAFGLAPITGKTAEMKECFTGYSNDSLAASAHGGDDATGSLTSAEFVVQEPYIAFLINGGNIPGKTAAQLVIDGKVVRESVGKKGLQLNPALWDVTDLKGRSARIRLVDDAQGSWGMIAADQFVFTDNPNHKFPSPTRDGKPFINGLVASGMLPGVSIPSDTALKIEATFAAQKITSPTALTFDDQGRIYISETHRCRAGIDDDRDRLYWYLDDLASKTTKDRLAMYEKWKSKAPLEKYTEKSEIIRRLADTDGDGKIDESKVFADGFNHPLDGTAAGVFYFENSLYFACIPQISMLRDKDGDGVADDRKTVAEGFGVRVSLSGHDLNGFTLGPEGRIWGTVGDRGMSILTKEGKAVDYPNEGAAFSFEPDGTDFKLFHTGLRNPKGIAFDALGNAFTVDNNSDQGDAARVVYLVEGGDSGWQMEHQAMHSFHRQSGLNEKPTSRWMDEKIWELQNAPQPAYIVPPAAYLTSGPSGLTAHPGTGFLESEAGRFLICDYRGASANSGIWSFRMEPEGAGMKMSDARQFMWGIAATDVEYSWDGKLFVTDFINGWKSHEDGRLVSLSAGEKTWQPAETASAAKIMRDGFEHRSSGELVNLLKHPDSRVRLRAQIALTRKPDAFTRFSDATASSNFMVRIHGVWGLGILSRRGPVPVPFAEFNDIPNIQSRMQAETKLITLLQDKNPEIRCQVLRVLSEADNESINLPLASCLADESMRVRFFAAILAGKRKLMGFYGPVCDMIQENDNRDAYLRHAGFYALEKMGGGDSKPIRALAYHQSPAVRLAATVALRRLKSPDVEGFIHDKDPTVADEAIRAVTDLDMVSLRPTVSEWMDQLPSRSWKPFMLRRLLHNSFRIGTTEEAERVVKFAVNTENPERERKEALRLLSVWVDPPVVDQLTGIYRPLKKRDVKTLRAPLTAALPDLIKQNGFAVTAALGLMGEYQLNVAGLDETSLRDLATNAELPPSARAYALNFVVERKLTGINDFLEGLAQDPAEEVGLAALRNLAKLSPASAIELLISGRAPRWQKSWEILATLPGEQVDSLIVKSINELRAANGISPQAIELLEAAKQRTSADVAAALAAYEKSVNDQADPLAKWNVALEGGDAKSGEAIFTSHPASECMRCHQAEAGHAAGCGTAPNLAGISLRHPDRRYFLESMVKPNAVIAPVFGAVLIDFKNGASLSGNLLEESVDHLTVDAAGKIFRISRSDIALLTPPVSPMPAMGDLLSLRELRDLVTWLATLKDGDSNDKPALAAIPLDPNTLPKPEAPITAIDPALMKSGKQQFMICGACHGQNGEGTAAGPPLAGSEWVNGPAENLIRIQLRGLQGPIKVKGQEYSFPGGMAALAYQTDDQVAAVLTYVRNSFGNSAPAVAPADVAKLRGEVGKPQVAVADLMPPVVAKSGNAVSPTTQAVAPAVKPNSDKYAQLDARWSGLRKTFTIAGGLILLGLLALIFKKKA